MEWDGGDFEEDAGGDGGDGQEDEDVAAGKHLVALGEADRDYVEVRGAGDAVENRETVGENAGAERAHQQVFHGGFVGAAFAAEEAGENGEGGRHGFE